MAKTSQNVLTFKIEGLVICSNFFLLLLYKKFLRLIYDAQNLNHLNNILSII